MKTFRLLDKWKRILRLGDYEIGYESNCVIGGNRDAEISRQGYGEYMIQFAPDGETEETVAHELIHLKTKCLEFAKNVIPEEYHALLDYLEEEIVEEFTGILMELRGEGGDERR